MKRSIFIMLSLLISLSVFSNSNFDKTVNFQFDNVQNYVGETLYLMPHPTKFTDHTYDYYPWFMDYSFDDQVTSEYNTYMHYKHYDGGTLNGTHKDHIEGHRFYVNKVVKQKRDEHVYIMYLTDLNTGDNLKYIYHSRPFTSINCFNDFPFIVEKHYNYCKSLIGTKLVFATHKESVTIFEMASYHYPLYEIDINTGNKISYSDSYVKWTIKDVEINPVHGCIAFIVSNGVHTTKVPYITQYNPNHPEYNIANRVFTETQWKTLVNKYGINHMKMIMETKVSNDMSLEEKYMSGGRRYAHNTIQKTITLKSELRDMYNNIKSLW